MCGDMGRTPKINKDAGRDHWPRGFGLLAGGAVKSGCVSRTSDKQATYPIDFPVTPGDLCAKIYELRGISHEATVPDQLTRPIPVSHGGQPVGGAGVTSPVDSVQSAKRNAGIERWWLLRCNLLLALIHWPPGINPRTFRFLVGELLP
jgi:hypothetical protein